MGGDKGKDSDTVTESSWRIARETSESEYSWDSERAGKTEIFDDGFIVDYN